MIPRLRLQRQTSDLSQWVRLSVVAGVVELGIVMVIVGWTTTPLTSPIPGARNSRAVTTPVLASDALTAPSHEMVDAPVAPSRPNGSTVGATNDASEVEICGFGTVRLQPDDPYPFQGIPLALRESALATVEALMLASDDIQVRAAALWIGIRRGKRDTRARIEQVARLATGSQDPVVYALAIEACKGWTSPNDGACHLISRAQWAHLDPDNAVPWQEVAAQAHLDNDPDTEEAAMRMAAYARHTDAREGLLPTLVERAMGTRVTPLQRTLALSESWSAQAVWAASHAPHVNGSDAKIAEPPAVGLDLSCDNVNRMQDWMRQRHNGDDALQPTVP